MKIEEVVDILKENEKGCEDRFFDLKNLDFNVSGGEIWLSNKDESYYFKKDMVHPKNPKVVYAARQFCKIIGVPFNFFFKNPTHMKKHIVECWMPSLKQEKSQLLAKLRWDEEGKCWLIRSLLPVEFSNISNLDIMENIADVAGDDFTIDFILGENKDDPVFHIRFSSEDSFTAFEEECSSGFSVIASEIGACHLRVETLLNRINSHTSMIASYGGESFFDCDYTKIQPNDIIVLFPKLIEHLKNRLPDLKEKIQTAKELGENQNDMRNMLKDIRLRKGLGERFHILLLQELAVDGYMANIWDFSNKIAAVAKEFDIEKRLKIERVAGDLIGLGFEKE